MLRSANIGTLLTTAALFPMWFLLTLYTQRVLGYTPLEAGLAQLPIALLIVFTAAPAQQLVTRIGPRIPFAGGLLLIAGGLFWFSQVSAGGSFLEDILGPSVLAGVGARDGVHRGHDRGDDRRRRRGRRARLRPAQHLPAGRRRDRDRGHRRDRHRADDTTPSAPARRCPSR